MHAEQLFHIGVKAVIFNPHKQILLLKRAQLNYWDLPGGRIQQNEEVLDALKREVQEETGLSELFHIKPQKIIITPIKNPINAEEEAQLILWIHTCSILHNQNILLSLEHNKFKWVELSALKNFLSNVYEPIIKEIGSLI